MDRNTLLGCAIGTICVALRKESVDRNRIVVGFRLPSLVALRKESVDRNLCLNRFYQLLRLLSLSARRAWIEICVPHIAKVPAEVALRKESVDRNNLMKATDAVKNRVALRKESVDRNFYYSNKDADWVRSLSARRAWIEILLP